MTYPAKLIALLDRKIESGCKRLSISESSMYLDGCCSMSNIPSDKEIEFRYRLADIIYGFYTNSKDWKEKDDAFWTEVNALKEEEI
tara:strand:- start:565 stop:822 length:258 start_codon:yes stop_codon:yes gene_type:complete